ncbi:MAG: hypothetical protein PSV35_02130 [bacterium]|nr:hypothetical protein [bacterium]
MVKAYEDRRVMAGTLPLVMENKAKLEEELAALKIKKQPLYWK